MARHDNTRLLIVPTGFILVIVCSTGGRGLRWGVPSADIDTERVKMQLAMSLASFPELKNASTGHMQLLEWLTAA